MRSMQAHPESAARVVARALVVATLASASRGTLIAAKDGYLLTGQWLLGLRSSARHLLEGLAWSLPLALVLAWLLGRRSPRAAGPLRLPLLLAAAALSYLFVSCRLPLAAWYVPGGEGARALGAHAIAALVALAVSLLLARRAPLPTPRLTATLAAGLLATAGILLVASAPGTPPRDRPSLILISLDTLRPDRLGCYGYDRPTSPELDRFAREALVFENATTPMPWTLTAHATMLTGLYPSVHGLDRDRSLPGRIPTVADLLQRSGYFTAAVVDRVVWMQPRYGFARGFDVYRNLPDDAAMKVEAMLRLLDDAPRAPLFLFAHFYDAHSDWRVEPYDAEPRDLAVLAGEYVGPWEAPDADGLSGSRYLQHLAANGAVPPPAEVAHLSDLYDAGIRSLDRQIGRLLGGLRERGLLESSIVVVTSDHGEEFFEHGQPLHSQYYGECVRIPLLVRGPGVLAGRSDALVSLVDLAPTLLELASVSSPQVQGSSLVPLLRAGAGLDRERVFLTGSGDVKGLRTARWSVVPQQGRQQLFDLQADPDELRDLGGAAEPPPALHDLARRIEAAHELHSRLREPLDSAPGVELSPEDLRGLRALGYGGN